MAQGAINDQTGGLCIFFSTAGLGLVQAPVSAFTGHKIVVWPHFYHFTAIHYH